MKTTTLSSKRFYILISIVGAILSPLTAQSQPVKRFNYAESIDRMKKESSEENNSSPVREFETEEDIKVKEVAKTEIANSRKEVNSKYQQVLQLASPEQVKIIVAEQQKWNQRVDSIIKELSPYLAKETLSSDFDGRIRELNAIEIEIENANKLKKTYSANGKSILGISVVSSAKEAAESIRTLLSDDFPQLAITSEEIEQVTFTDGTVLNHAIVYFIKLPDSTKNLAEICSSKIPDNIFNVSIATDCFQAILKSIAGSNREIENPDGVPPIKGLSLGIPLEQNLFEAIKRYQHENNDHNMLSNDGASLTWGKDGSVEIEVGNIRMDSDPSLNVQQIIINNAQKFFSASEMDGFAFIGKFLESYKIPVTPSTAANGSLKYRAKNGETLYIKADKSASSALSALGVSVRGQIDNNDTSDQIVGPIQIILKRETPDSAIEKNFD